MIVVGLGIVVVSLGMGLVEAHVRRQKVWDRPRWTLTRLYAAAAGPARRAVLLVGLIVLLGASPLAAAATVAALVALWAWLRWVNSERHGVRVLAREVDRRKRARPGLGDSEALRGILLERHARWGEELIDRILADHPDPAAARRMIVRMERGAAR